VTPEEEVRRGLEAKSLLDNPIYREAYQTIRDNIVTQLSLADTADDKRARLNNLLIALGKVEQYMRQVMSSGVMAEIERERTLADKLFRRA